MSGRVSFAEPSALSRVLAAASFAATVLLIGVPVWLKTTQVYRASVPFSDIELLRSEPLSHLVSLSVELVANDADLSRIWQEHLQSCRVKVSVSGRRWTDEELVALYSGAGAWAVEDHSSSVSAQQDDAKLNVFLLPDNFTVGVQQAGDIWLGRDRHVFLTRSASNTSVCRLLGRYFSDSSDQIETSITRIRSADKYRLLVSLVVPDPRSGNVEQHSSIALCALLQPFINQLRPLANISVTSQYLHSVDFNFAVRHNSSSLHYYIDQESMSLLITPLETGLGSYVSSETTLNFVLYVVPASHRPLVMYTQQSGQVSGFVSPRWGGVQLINSLPLNVTATAAVIGSQLRQLLGIHTRLDPAVMYRHAPLRVWEVDIVRAVRTMENLDNARRNLVSLAAMLERISNIVIGDHVAEAVWSSVRCVVECSRLLPTGHHQTAYLLSVKALRASETAIYDASMLSRLYFPDDQKYAIYIPLFLPISLPVLASLRTIVSYVSSCYTKRKID